VTRKTKQTSNDCIVYAAGGHVSRGVAVRQKITTCTSA